MTISSENVVSRRRRRRGGRAFSGTNFPGSGYEALESAQGGETVGEPVECYRFSVGATVYRYTSADRNITLAIADVGTYTPTVVDRDSIDFSQEDTAQNVAVRLLTADPVAQLFIAYNPIVPVALTIIRKHRTDPEEVVQFVGKVLSVVFEGPQATLTCAPISEVFRRRIPSLVFQSQCNWALYGPGCGLDKNAFKDSGTVLAVSGASVQAAIFGTRPDGWYNNGWLELASGDRRFILAHVGEVVTLQTAFPALTVGASVDAYAGCDRTETTCAAKFNNLVNHLGFPRIPTRNPYDGKLT